MRSCEGTNDGHSGFGVRSRGASGLCFQLRQPCQGLVTGGATHVRLRLQRAADGGSVRVAKQPTAQSLIELPTRDVGGLGLGWTAISPGNGGTDGGRDAACCATRPAVHGKGSSTGAECNAWSKASSRLVRCCRATSCQHMPDSAPSSAQSRLRLAWGEVCLT